MCIGQQLRNVLNDKGRLGIIYKGLMHFILAKHGGAANIPRIKHQHCISPPSLEHPFSFQLHGVKFFTSGLLSHPGRAAVGFSILVRVPPVPFPVIFLDMLRTTMPCSDVCTVIAFHT